MQNPQQDANFAKVHFVTITAAQQGQRIDNFFLTLLKGVPKSRIYRLLRKGEIRVNKKRVTADYRLVVQDEVRIPPIRIEAKPENIPGSRQIALIKDSIIYEDDELLIINKPAGLAVHAGTETKLGVIEIFRYMRPESSFLELVHRLDKATSGCLMLAKSRDMLLYLHAALKQHQIIKRYQALVHGYWPEKLTHVRLALSTAERTNVQERKVKVQTEEGKVAHTEFKVIQRYTNHTLIEATLHTGRTHQIRVHTAAMGHPIVGDDKYGKREADKALKIAGAKGMYLHSTYLSILLPHQKKPLTLTAPVPEHWQDLIKHL